MIKSDEEKPDVGYHVEIIPRSNFSRSGWVMPNSFGLIDKSFIGTLKVPVIRVSENAEPIEKYYKDGFQIIMRPSIYVKLEEVKEHQIIPTTRGSGGFGSTIKVEK